MSGDKIGILFELSANSLNILFCLDSAIAPNVPNITDTNVEIPATNNVFIIGSLKALDVNKSTYQLNVNPVNTINEFDWLNENIIIDIKGTKTNNNTAKIYKSENNFNLPLVFIG